jgi:hypothetical protein
MRRLVLTVLLLTSLLTPTAHAEDPEIQPRVGHRLIFIPETGTAILFGGMSLYPSTTHYNDLWTYSTDENTWTKITAFPAPSSRSSPGLAHNPHENECLLYGGYGPSGRLGDTWFLDTETMTWTELAPVASPPPRSDAGLEYDPKEKIYILYGGYGTTGSLLDDTWVYDPTENTWSQIETATTPGKMYGHSMMWNPATEEITLYGGHIGSPVSGDYLNEIWVLDQSSRDWRRVETTGRPEGRYWIATDIAGDGTLVSFGGARNGPHNDTSTLDTEIGAWTTTTPDPSPSPRFFAQLAHTRDHEFLLFGGGTPGEEYNDTWTYSTETGWTRLEPTIFSQPTEQEEREPTGFDVPLWEVLLVIGLAFFALTRKSATNNSAS